MPETDILERLKAVKCAKCKGVGYTEHHQPGHTHYETDRGEPCPPYHYKRIPCESCGAVLAAIAEIESLRQREKEWRALGAETPSALGAVMAAAIDAVTELTVEVERQGLLLRGKTFPAENRYGAVLLGGMCHNHSALLLNAAESSQCYMCAWLASNHNSRVTELEREVVTMRSKMEAAEALSNLDEARKTVMGEESGNA